MLKINETIYCIRQMEWKILLAKEEIDDILGFSFAEEELTEQEMVKVLHQMVKRKMLCAKEGRFLVQEPYKNMLEQIKKSGFGLYLRQKAEQERQMFVYAGEELVICRPAKNQREAIEVQLLEKEKWLSYLWEEKYFPYYQTECKMGEIKSGTGQFVQSEEVFAMPFVETVLSKMDFKEQRENGWLAFSEQDGRQKLFWKDGETDYTMDGLAYCMKGMMK